MAFIATLRPFPFRFPFPIPPLGKHNIIYMNVRLIVTLAVAAAALASRSEAQSKVGASQYRIEYTIAMPDPASHLYSITLFVGGLTGRSIELQLPVWSPGRYAKMDFAKNVQEFVVTASDGKPMRWDKTNGSRWRIHPGSARSMRVSYRVFANAPMSGTFSVLDT